MIQNSVGAANTSALIFVGSEEIGKHAFYMRKCVGPALIAKRKGHIPVGSIIIRNGKIVAETVEGIKVYKDITYHAEIVAFW